MRIPKDHTSSATCAGEQFEIIYKAKVMPNGVIELIEDGKKDLKEEHNSWRDITDMSYILKQMQLGNTQVLMQKEGFYGDITNAPKNMQEAMQIMIDAEREFYKLPAEVRDRFNNNLNEFIATAGEEVWARKMWPEKFVEEKEEVNADVS